jgi:uncharacterized protein YaaQ
MKRQALLLIISPHQSLEPAVRELSQVGFPVTPVSPATGFLDDGRVAVLKILEDQVTPYAIASLAAACRERVVLIHTVLDIPPAGTHQVNPPLRAGPGEGTIFLFRVGGLARPSEPPDHGPFQGGEAPMQEMKLVVAIIAAEDAVKITNALTDAQYRATLISTTGGFLHKGNATLLIGVESNRVDQVLKLIADSSSVRQSKPNGAGGYGSAFVVAVEELEQV